MHEPRPRVLDAYVKDGHHVHKSLDDLLAGDLVSGLHSIDMGGVWFDVLYQDVGAPVTLVAFTAAVPLDHSYPVFSGWSFPKPVGVNLLAFSDPAIGCDVPIRTFWHLGTPEICAPTIIRRILDHVCPDSSATLFFGASAGGYAALMHSAERPGSAAVLLNPRTDLTAPPEMYREAEALHLDGAIGSLVLERAEKNLAVTYGRPRGNHIFHVQNLRDAQYLKYQYGPFRDAMKGRPEYHRITGSWGQGHVAPPRGDYIKHIASLANSAPNWSVD